MNTEDTHLLILIRFSLTNTTQHFLSWGTYSSAASQGNSPYIMQPESSLTHSQQPTTCKYSDQDEYFPRHFIIFP